MRQKFLLPNFKSNGAEFCSIATAAGLTARDVARQYGFAACIANSNDVISDSDANLIVIATRHDTHASLAQTALEQNKHVFVEKPLAMNDAELDGVLAAAEKSSGRLMVGFNRRFSPIARQAKEFFGERQFPLSILYRINSGRIPKDSWVQDPIQGGGRIVGEVCHFIDLMQFLTGSVTTRVFAEAVTSRNHDMTEDDSTVITLRFDDGSNGTIAYLAEGDRTIPKERVEIFGGGKTFVLDDFRQASMYSGGKETAKKLGTQDKGQKEEVRVVCNNVLTGGEAPIALADLAATTRATLRILDSLRTGEAMDF